VDKMTVQSTKNKIQHISLADQTDFTYDFIILEDTDMKVSVDFVEYFEEYTVDGVGDPNGGTVFLSTPQIEGAVVVLYRLMQATQEIDYKKYDAFPAETHERGLDKLTLLIQQVNDFAIGAVRFPLAEIFGPNSILPPADERSLKFLFFDTDGGVGVSDGTAIGGEGVKSVGIHPDSTLYLAVDASDAQAPLIQVRSPNQPNKLVTTDNLGRIPSDVVPGVQFERLEVTPYAIDMLAADNTVPEVPAMSTRTINQPLSLIQLDTAGKIPPELVNFVGMRNLGVYRGDNLCDKAGDNPGECIVPDHRNPSERFPTLADLYQRGDFFIFRMEDPEISGEVNLFQASGDLVTTPVTVEAGDGCIYIEELLDENLVILISEGWYYIDDLVATTSAEFVAYDPTGNQIILPGDINVDLALNRLDLNALDKQVGGFVGGPIQVADAPVLDNDLTNKLYVDFVTAAQDARLDDLEARMLLAEGEIDALQLSLSIKLEATDYATETIGGTVKIRVSGFDGFISTTANNP
jgi:hypothetical protein